MKTSLKKLRGFAALHKHGEHRDRIHLRPLSQLDELAQASKDMEDMRSCYDSLLSAAAATANSAYEFSESLCEMGACLLEKTALNEEEESGRVLLMLGKAQFELQKLVDNYRSHIFQTITSPSESLLNELQTVEEMKLQCDQKRDIYEDMMRPREKVRGKNGKGENFSMQQLEAAYDEFDEEAALFIFRLKSLKKGQSHSLLTQAARHHAAQLCFFRKALKSLEAVEPHVKLVTEQQHIDYHFSGLEDDCMDDHYEVDDGSTDEELDDGELSFDYGTNDQEQDVPTSRNSMELDKVEDVTFPKVGASEATKENIVGSHRKSFSLMGDIRTVSQSAPLFTVKKSDPAEKMIQLRPLSSRRFNTYVLPTPVDAKNLNPAVSASPRPGTLNTSLSGRTRNLWHSSPLQPKKYEKERGDERYSGPIVKNAQSVLKDSNSNTAPTRLPPPLADGLLFSRVEPLVASDSKKLKRYAFSGPIARQPWPSKATSGELPKLSSGPLLPNPKAQSLSPPTWSTKVSPTVSPCASPPFVSSPKISELHELPRPPLSSRSKSSRPPRLLGHSAPLTPKGPISHVSKAASPLPTPSQVVTRSFSIPSSGLRGIAFNDLASPPLTPISLSNIQPLPIGSSIVNQSVQITGPD